MSPSVTGILESRCGMSWRKSTRDISIMMKRISSVREEERMHG